MATYISYFSSLNVQSLVEDLNIKLKCVPVTENAPKNSPQGDQLFLLVIRFYNNVMMLYCSRESRWKMKSMFTTSKSINVNYSEWHIISSQIRLEDWIPQSITESCKAGEATRSLCIARLRLTQISELQKICLHSDWSSSPYKRGLNLDLPFSQDADLHSIEHLLSPSLPTVESRESSWWNKVESPRPLIFTLM